MYAKERRRVYEARRGLKPPPLATRLLVINCFVTDCAIGGQSRK
jgi:hypothetical protein